MNIRKKWPVFRCSVWGAAKTVYT